MLLHPLVDYSFPPLSLSLSPPSQVGQQVVPKEVALLNCVKHKYIIKMLDYFEDNDNFYIVMERPEKYIDLFDYISGKRIMSERSARFLFRQVRTEHSVLFDNCGLWICTCSLS